MYPWKHQKYDLKLPSILPLRGFKTKLHTWLLQTFPCTLVMCELGFLLHSTVIYPNISCPLFPKLPFQKWWVDLQLGHCLVVPKICYFSACDCRVCLKRNAKIYWIIKSVKYLLSVDNIYYLRYPFYIPVCPGMHCVTAYLSLLLPFVSHP